MGRGLTNRCPVISELENDYNHVVPDLLANGEAEINEVNMHIYCFSVRLSIIRNFDDAVIQTEIATLNLGEHPDPL